MRHLSFAATTPPLARVSLMEEKSRTTCPCSLCFVSSKTLALYLLLPENHSPNSVESSTVLCHIGVPSRTILQTQSEQVLDDEFDENEMSVPVIFCVVRCCAAEGHYDEARVRSQDVRCRSGFMI